MNISRCLGDVVCVKLPLMEQTEGGLFIPECYKKENRYTEGVVVAHGPGKRSVKTGKLTPVDVQVGDNVLLDPHNFTTHELDGVRYAFCHEDELLGVTDGFHGNEMHKLWLKEGDNDTGRD